MTFPFNEYECPECGEDVRVELPAGKYVKCPECMSNLEIHADADFKDGMWHDRTTLSVADPGREHMERMLEWAKSQRAFDGEDAEAWQRKSDNEPAA